MLVNSFNFLIFFTVVFLGYHLLFKEKTKAQNILLLLASYFFYGFAEIKMIPLLIAVTIIYYGLGIAIQKANETSERKASWLKTVGVLIGVGVLVYFKYFNFFITSFQNFFEAIGLKFSLTTFNILMPLGISFFTFKLISYVLEVHRERMDATRDFVSFATFVAFFPTIMSGPIDRPNTFIPQLQKKKKFDYVLAVDGCRQILWGIFKKVVIADNLALAVNPVWENITGSSGSTLFYTAILYSFQLYADFSGYSDMAIGVGKLLGFRIAINFRYPFFALNIADFWRRWHISLTSWMTDYVFMPLNIKFRDLGKWGLILAILINMFIIGLWHGANWVFVIFGLYHGLLFIPLILSGGFSKKIELETTKFGLPAFKTFLYIWGTFLLVAMGMIIFRAENIDMAYQYFRHMLDFSLFTFPVMQGKTALLFVLIMLCSEWIGRNREYSLQLITKIKKRSLRWAIYFILIFLIMTYNEVQSTFIYFQF